MPEAIKNAYVNITTYLPNDTSIKMGENFIYNAALTTLFTQNPAFGIIRGFAGFMASFFDSFGSSIIRNVLERNELTWYQDYAKKIVVLAIVVHVFSNVEIIASLSLLVLYQLFQGTMFSDVRIDKSSFMFITN